MMASFLLPSASLTSREMTRFFRQRNRVIGALATPLVFWILMGAGLTPSFKPPSMPADMSALEYFVPGIMTLIILFTSIFSTISIIEDRSEGFLQSVLVSPISQASIVAGKVLGGSLIAFVQASLFLVISLLAGIQLNAAALLLSLLLIFLLGFSLTALGFALAWRMDSTMGFHALMNLFLMPMWLLSGSFFPMSGVHPVLYWVMKLNPLTYGVAGLRQALYHSRPESLGDLPSLATCLVVTVLFGLVFFGLSLVMVRSHRTPKI
jgi:ABC-2 type transport system permease protein